MVHNYVIHMMCDQWLSYGQKKLDFVAYMFATISNETSHVLL